MAFQVTSGMGMPLNTLWLSSRLPFSAYTTTRLLPTQRHLDSKLLPIICLWGGLPSSITTTLVYTFRTPSKVAGSGSIPFCCICLNNSNAFCHSPYLTSHKIMAFPAIISCMGTSEGTLSKHPLRSTPLSYKFTRLSAQGHQTDNHLGESNHRLHHEQQWLIAIIPHWLHQPLRVGIDKSMIIRSNIKGNPTKICILCSWHISRSNGKTQSWCCLALKRDSYCKNQ